MENVYSFDKLKAVSSSDVYNSNEWKKLLHYKGNRSSFDKKSDFFLSPTGYKDSKSEYFATIKGITDENLKDDNSIICRFPARFQYIKKALGLTDKNFKHQNCKHYNEFLLKVPIDKISLIFASENNKSPLSIMGHNFIKLTGKDSNNISRQHTISYSAMFDNTQSLLYLLKILLKLITGGDIAGYYTLFPYNKKMNEYLIRDKRNIWEFDLDLTNDEIKKIQQHLWELKNIRIKYSLISHNCNTATADILKISDSVFAETNVKPFETPVEYIQQLYKNDKITAITIIPTEYTKQRIKKNNIVKNILTANRSSRIEYRYNNKDHSFLTISPIYQDIRDVNFAYFDESDSKVGEITVGYKDKFFLQQINVLKARNITDYYTQKNLSTHFKLAFENNFFKYKTNIKPTVEFGLGYGYYNKYFTAFYILPTVGYRHSHYDNFYLTPEIGMIMSFNKIKFLTSYKYYFDSKKNNNRGYKNVYNSHLGYKVFDDLDLYIEYDFYTKASNKNRLSAGTVFRF